MLPHLSKAAVLLLLSKGRQAAQGGDGGVTTAAAGLSGGRLAVDAVVVPVQVVVTRRAEQGAWRGQGAGRAPAVGVGGGLPERH